MQLLRPSTNWLPTQSISLQGGIYLYFTYMGLWNELSSPHSYDSAERRADFGQPVEGQRCKFLSSRPDRFRSIPRKISGRTKDAGEDGRLVFHGTAEKFHNHYTFKELLDSCYGRGWIPCCKKTFNGAQSVISYLGKYTHRIAVSNHRMIRMDGYTITFSVKDYRNDGKWKGLTISGVEFVQRFLMHVPPKRLVRIRHYGLLCSRTKNQELTLCRNLLGCGKYLSKLRDMEMPEILEHLYGIKVCLCKTCGGHLGKPQMRIPLRCWKPASHTFISRSFWGFIVMPIYWFFVNCCDFYNENPI